MMVGFSPSSEEGLVDQPLETTLQLCLNLLEEIGSARSLSVALLIKYKEWDQVALGLPLDPMSYNDHESFFRDYQATKLLSKADFIPTSFDRRAVALGRFESAELQCEETNSRWRSVYVDGSGKPESDVDRIISMTKHQISHILGRFPTKRLLSACKWGPGATTSIRNPRTSVYEKYREPLTGSGQCLTLFSPLLDQVALWKDFQKSVYCVSDGNRVVFVPKDAKTERSIAVEPSFDTFIQGGIGALMKERLLHHGVDLSSQDLNQSLARYGSLTGKVATVDLSMASDTVAKLPVDLLLPEDWLVVMKSCRSSLWRQGRRTGRYHKFSSMGNGYTFELETLLFFAVLKSIAIDLELPSWEVNAYGDDLTIGVEGVDLLRRTLSFLGFSFNASKSYDSGPFRESCGKDYFLGHNVRPYFVRSVLRDERDLMGFHNGVLKGLIPFPITANKAMRMVGVERRHFGPSQLGDTVFWSSKPRGWFMPASKRYPMFEGFIVRHWVFKPEKESVRFYEPSILASLHSNATAPTRGKHTLRKRGAWVTKTVIVPYWDDEKPV